jgi:hypothetical protein
VKLQEDGQPIQAKQLTATSQRRKRGTKTQQEPMEIQPLFGIEKRKSQ